MPTHLSDQIAQYRAQTSREMPLQGQEIIGDRVVNTSRHTMRCKLEEWKGNYGRSASTPMRSIARFVHVRFKRWMRNL